MHKEQENRSARDVVQSTDMPAEAPLCAMSRDGIVLAPERHAHRRADAHQLGQPRVAVSAGGTFSANAGASEFLLTGEDRPYRRTGGAEVVKGDADGSAITGGGDELAVLRSRR